MEKDLKDILLKDFCARLPYNVKGLYYSTVMSLHMVDPFDNYHPLYCVTKSGSEYIGIDEFKPYLFPLSSMTEEQKREYHELIGGFFGTSALINFEDLEELFYKNHIDFRGLIPKGLAIDATGLNIY